MMDLLRPFRLVLAVVVGIGLAGCASSQSASSGEEERVHTGYGTQKESDVTSATSKIDAEDKSPETATDLSDLLRGQAAGVQVERSSGGVRVTIRGTSTIYGDSTPLYVVDGTPVEARFDGTVPVHPHDIQSITILKDAGATSLYGAQGANGVIVIETKDE